MTVIQINGRIERPEINTQIYDQLIFKKGIRTTECRKDKRIIFLTNGAGTTEYSHAKK